MGFAVTSVGLLVGGVLVGAAVARGLGSAHKSSDALSMKVQQRTSATPDGVTQELTLGEIVDLAVGLELEDEALARTVATWREEG